LSEDKGFLSRWSDRKLSAEQDESALPSADIQQADEPAEEFEGKSDDEILSILELPDPETLTLGDTVEKFMSGRVPERIRARALRAFWKTNPVLANLDGLDEYWDDYTDAAMIIENMETIYQVGKGYASQALDALESLAEDEGQVDEAVSLDSVDQTISGRTRLVSPPLDENSMFISEPAADSEDLKTPLDQDEEPVDTVLPKPQRMAFR
jgi:soluble lytic murein transglycosylase-like protein